MGMDDVTSHKPYEDHVGKLQLYSYIYCFWFNF